MRASAPDTESRAPRQLRVSVVIPTANARPSSLARAIRSVLDQQRGGPLADVELIVANNSPRPLEYEARHLPAESNWRVVDASRADGVSVARNEGARQARYDVLAFLDDDDWWSPSFLEEMTTSLRDHDLDLVVCGRSLYDGVGERPGPLLSREVTLQFALARNPGLTGSNLLLRRELFERLGGFDEGLRTWNDMDLFVRVLLDGEVRWAPLARRLVHEDRSSHEQLTQPSVTTVNSIVAYLERHAARMQPRTARHVRFRLALAEALCARSYVRMSRLALRHPRHARQVLGAALKMAQGRFIRL